MADLIKEGSYKARGVSIVWGKSENKGTPQVTVAFAIQEGPDKGQILEWRGYMTDGTSERTAESLAICGYEPDAPDPDSTIGTNEVVLVVENETYTSATNGKTYTNPRVKWINDPNRAARS